MQQFVKIATSFFNQKLPVISPLLRYQNLNDSGNESTLRYFCQSYLGDRLDEFNYSQLSTVLSLLSSNIMDNGFVFKNNKLHAIYCMNNKVNVFVFPSTYPNDDIKKLHLSALFLIQGFIPFMGSDFIENYIEYLDKEEEIRVLCKFLETVKAIEREIQLYEFDSELFIVKYPEYKDLINLFVWCKNLYNENSSNYDTYGDINYFSSFMLIPDTLYFNSDFIDYYYDTYADCYIDDLLVELKDDLSMDIYPMAIYYLCVEIEKRFLPAADT